MPIGSPVSCPSRRTSSARSPRTQSSSTRSLTTASPPGMASLASSNASTSLARVQITTVRASLTRISLMSTPEAPPLGTASLMTSRYTTNRSRCTRAALTTLSHTSSQCRRTIELPCASSRSWTASAIQSLSMRRSQGFADSTAFGLRMAQSSLIRSCVCADLPPPSHSNRQPTRKSRRSVMRRG